MRLEPTAEQDAFREEVRTYFRGVMEPWLRSAVEDDSPGVAERYKEWIHRVGKDGWLCPTWPTEWGGRDLSPVEQLIYFDETQRQRVPIPFLTTTTVGPTIMQFGTDAQKQEFLPRILAGEVLFSIGYSEPGAGTDLASLTTRAERDGDHFVVTGQKMWTSLIHVADYVWLACRTNPDVPKHKGISILLVPTDDPGFSYQKVDTMGGGFTSATHYDGIRVPVDNVVGEIDGGWRLITNQLNAERISLASAGQLQRRLDEVTAWARSTTLADGRRVIDQPRVQRALAKVTAQVAPLRLMNWQVADEAVHGDISPVSASTMKVYGSELFIEAYRALAEVVGSRAMVRADEPGAILGAELEDEMSRSLILTFGGGVNEIQRGIITALGLGMPRPRR